MTDLLESARQSLSREPPSCAASPVARGTATHAAAPNNDEIYADCPVDRAKPSSFEEAFEKEIRTHLSPWASSMIGMSQINYHLLHAASWCREQACIAGGRLFLRGWRRSGAKAGAAVSEYLSESRHHAAILGLAQVLQRHRVDDVCVTINCQDRPAVHRYLPSHIAGTATPTPVQWDVTSRRLFFFGGRPGAPLILSYMSSADHLE